MAIQQVGHRGQLNLRPYLFAATVGCIQSGTDACKAASALNHLLHIHVDRPHTWSQTTNCISTSEQASTFTQRHCQYQLSPEREKGHA